MREFYEFDSNVWSKRQGMEIYSGSRYLYYDRRYCHALYIIFMNQNSRDTAMNPGQEEQKDESSVSDNNDVPFPNWEPRRPLYQETIRGGYS